LKLFEEIRRERREGVSIRKVTHRSGRISWQARWRDPTGAQRSTNLPRRIESERFVITIEARKLAGTYIDPRAGRIRLGEFAEQATAGCVNRRDSTKARDESYLRSLVLSTFADMPIGKIGLGVPPSVITTSDRSPTESTMTIMNRNSTSVIATKRFHARPAQITTLLTSDFAHVDASVYRGSRPWALLGSNQWPLPCEGRNADCRCLASRRIPASSKGFRYSSRRAITQRFASSCLLFAYFLQSVIRRRPLRAR
jgi:hypothetical protein